MAKRKKKLNTGLVAFLTLMGMVVVVSVAGLVIYHGTQRDPDVLAQNAAERAAAGDLVKAAEFYQRAYRASGQSDPNFVIQAAACWFELGELSNWHTLLREVHTLNPQDVTILRAILEGMWRIQEITGGRVGTGWEQLRRDYAQALLDVQPDDALALVSQARALWALRGEENLAAADAAAQRAYEAAPDDPRAVLTYAILQLRQVQEELGGLRQRGAPQRQIEARWEEFVQARPALLGPAVEKSPGHGLLVRTYADALTDQARERLRKDSADTEALAMLDRAEGVLRSALEADPTSAEMQLALAEQLRLRMAAELEGLDAEERARRIEEMDGYARRAIELDKAMYPAYILRARLELFAPVEAVDGAARQAERAARYDAALNVYEDAAQETVTLWKENVRARLRDQDRLRMLHEAFNTALDYFRIAQDESERKEAVARAEVFLQDAQTKYPEQAITFYMQGELAAAQGDVTRAMQSYIRASEKAAGFGVAPAEYWRLTGFGILPAERLSDLYREAGQLGEAERYADQAIAQYERDLNERPPVALIVKRSQLYRTLGKPEEGLALVDKYRRDYPDDLGLTTERFVLLQMLGRGDEVTAADVADTRGLAGVLQRVQVALAGEDFDTAERLLVEALERSQNTPVQQEFLRQRMVDLAIWRAQVAGREQDYAGAIGPLEHVLGGPDATPEQKRRVLTMYVAAMSRLERQAEAQEKLQALIAAAPDQPLVRTMQAYVVMLSETDPQKRRAELLKLIEQNPDPFQRAQELYSFYAGEEPEKAIEYLAEMRALRPDDLALVEQEFRGRLALGQLDRARALLVTLSGYNDGEGYDQAGGATYRGYLALAEQQPQVAVREFTSALRTLPQTATLEVELGRACLMAGQFDDGVASLKRALEMDPRNFEALRLLTIAYEREAADAFGARKTECERAMEEYLTRAEALRKSHPDIVAARERLMARSRPVQAINQFLARWREDPNDRGNARQLAELFARLAPAVRQRGGGEAEQFVTQGDAFFEALLAQDLGTETLSTTWTAAQYYAESGRPERGEAVLQQAVDKVAGGEKLTAQLLLARYYQRIGAAEPAERAYLAAQQLVADTSTDAAEQKDLQRRVGMAMADFYEEQKRPAQVVQVCRWILDQVGTSDLDVRDVRLKMIENLLEAGRLNEADTEIESYLSDHGQDSASGLIARAMLHLARREYRSAEKDLDVVLRVQPEHGWSRFTRGAMRLRRGDYEGARSDLEEALKLVRDPDLEFRIRERLVGLFGRTKQIDLAERELRAMLDLLEEVPDAVLRRRQVVTRLVRLLYDQAKQFNRAQEIISEHMERHPDESLWPHELGELFKSRAEEALRLAQRAEQRGEAARAREQREAARQDFLASVPYYQKAAALAGPQRPVMRDSAIMGWMNALTQAGRPQETMAVLNSLPMEPTPGIRMHAARALRALQQPAEARAQWQEALKIAAEYEAGLAGRLAAELRSDLPAEEAEQLLRELADAAPAGSTAGLRLRLLVVSHMILTGNATAALPVVQQVLNEAEAGTQVYVDALLMRAQALDATGDDAAAMDTYREVLKYDEGNLAALNNLAYSLVTEDALYRPEEAKVYAERLWQLLGRNSQAATILDTVGWVFYHADDLEMAVTALEEARTASDVVTPAVHLHLGMVYAKQGRTAEARQTLNEGLELARQDSEGGSELMAEIQAQLEQLR